MVNIPSLGSFGRYFSYNSCKGMLAWPPKDPLSLSLCMFSGCLVDAGMIYYLMGYGNMPFLEMIVSTVKNLRRAVCFI